MRYVMAACLGVAGILSGLLIGYALWGQHAGDLASELAKANEELVTTRGWLLDEIELSDGRQGHTSARLTQALAELGQARDEAARIAEGHEEVSAALRKARAELAQVRGELARVGPRLGYDNNVSASPSVNREPR
jgi:multidrug resistance efflux pump